MKSLFPGLMLMVAGATSSAWSQQSGVAALQSKLHEHAMIFAQAVQARDTKPIHEIDHDMPDETAAFKKLAPPLNDKRRHELEELCDDLVAQATRAHHAGHHGDWDEAAAAQAKFAEDVGKVAALLDNPK